ncbi:MAG: DUF58 domain-containing protein [Alphaproteobacteria bacterium]
MTYSQRHQTQYSGVSADIQAEAMMLANMFSAISLPNSRSFQTGWREGNHPNRQKARAGEFWQYRPYMAGDDASSIDWKASGRGAQLLVRETERKVPAKIYGWIDSSPSMNFSSETVATTKHRRAALLLTALSILLRKAGEEWQFTMLPDQPLLPEEPASELKRRTGSRLSAFPCVRGSTLILASDFLFNLEKLREFILLQNSQNIRVLGLQILDPQEIDFSYQGHCLFESMEKEGKKSISEAADLQQFYQQKFLIHQQTLSQHFMPRLGFFSGLSTKGGTFMHNTNEPPSRALENLRLMVIDQ